MDDLERVEALTVFVPFLGDFFQFEMPINKKTAVKVFVPFLGDFFQFALNAKMDTIMAALVFVPFLGDFFQFMFDEFAIGRIKGVFVPFLGDFFQLACLRSPRPSALASTFAAGMRGSLHQALSFGDEMPIFPGRTGIGGDLQ